MDLKEFLGQQFSGLKRILRCINIGLKSIFKSRNNFGLKKTVGQRKFCVKKMLGVFKKKSSKKVFLGCWWSSGVGFHYVSKVFQVNVNGA